MKGQAVRTDATEILVSRARDRDERAFEELVKRFQPRLGAQIRSRMGPSVRAKMEVQDVLSETFACAFQSIARLNWQGEETFYRWLASIAEHVIRNASRKKGWDQLQLEKDVPGSDTSPPTKLRRRERFERLEKALQGLSADHQRALMMARIEGLKIREIAAKMERSPDAVKKLLARALVELKRSFGDTESLHLPHGELRVERTDDED